MSKGWISLSVEALHDEEELLFNFLEKEFKILEMDHSSVATSNIVRFLLEDSSCKWFVPTVDTLFHEYEIKVDITNGIPNFKVILIHETKTHSY